jgi:hypothetical protein
MKKAMVLFSLLTLFCVLCARQVSAQEKSNITVRGSELNNGVVIMDVLKASKAYQLQCNQGAAGCTNLRNRDYLMVELPKNFGMYECRDVEVYPESAATPDTALPDKDKKLGEYCLVEKRRAEGIETGAHFAPMAACLQFAGAIMCKLKINCVRRLPRGAEDLAPDILELWIGASHRKVDVNIVRRGFILADPVMHAIRERIKRLAVVTANINKPLPERIGLSPGLSSDWRQYLDDLLQKDDSWSFLVYSGTNLRPS